MGQANIRALSFVADAARPVVDLMMRSFAASGHSSVGVSELKPTPGARVFHVADDACGQALAGTGALSFEGEVLEPRASSTLH